MDLASQFDAFEQWDTQCPLSWDVPAPGHQKVQLIDLLPSALSAVNAAVTDDSEASDFEIFNSILNSFATRGEAMNTNVELRHYLAIAYSMYQERSDLFVNVPTWPWGTFLKSIQERLLGVVSYNYDLNVETVLEATGVRMRHLAVKGSIGTIPLAKPHGSIDYIPAHNIIGGMLPKYPLQVYMEANDYTVERKNRESLIAPRFAADIVIPTEKSQYTQFQWVLPCRRWITTEGKRAKILLLLGLSYWPVDRIEINEIIDSVLPEATIIVANPHPSAELIDRLESRFKTVEVWSNGPNSKTLLL